MPRREQDEWDRTFDERASRYERTESLKTNALRFMRYLSTRNVECWGFFAAGFLVATIF
jgi:hypothetical protein